MKFSSHKTRLSLGYRVAYPTEKRKKGYFLFMPGTAELLNNIQEVLYYCFSYCPVVVAVRVQDYQVIFRYLTCNYLQLTVEFNVQFYL